MIQIVDFSAGQTREFLEVGDFFRYLEGVGPISVTYYKAGREITDAEGIKPGYGEFTAAQAAQKIHDQG